mmetsp:Transcript_15671/g.32194  ORF Transcript_15671/g.32194 Transcript_15671/m.32194 type:complete len:207 (+) Transcript_15671:188-808(+)
MPSYDKMNVSRDTTQNKKYIQGKTVSINTVITIVVSSKALHCISTRCISPPSLSLWQRWLFPWSGPNPALVSPRPAQRRFSQDFASRYTLLRAVPVLSMGRTPHPASFHTTVRGRHRRMICRTRLPASRLLILLSRVDPSNNHNAARDALFSFAPHSIPGELRWHSHCTRCGSNCCSLRRSNRQTGRSWSVRPIYSGRGCAAKYLR